MSRRDSRVHISVRQNDTLQEFQNFKKSFLVANKQITKQNSSLSAKIEELNAHISSLYVENLRLRASEIALSSQLKREKEKCQKIMADAEAATMNLLKHLGIIRQSYSISPPDSSSGKSTPDLRDSDSPPQAPSLRPRPRSPTAPRLSQQPSVPDIVEEAEPHEASSDERDYHHDAHHGSHASSKSKGKHGSRLPVPSRVVSPPPPATTPRHYFTASETSQKPKLTRRPSGLMGTPADMPERPFSPTFNGSHHVGLDLSDDEIVEVEVLSKHAHRGENEALKREDDARFNSHGQETAKEKIKKEKRSRPKDVDSEQEGVTERKPRKKRSGNLDVKLQDVTNSPRPREAASPVEIPSDSNAVIKHRDVLSPPPTDLPRSSSPSGFSDPGYLPTPQPSSTSSTPVPTLTLPLSDIDPNAVGREKRARKSVNYTEPSLRKKMRKPDSVAPPGTRPSLSITIPSPEPTPPPESQRRHSLDSTDTEGGSNPLSSNKPRSSGSSRSSSSTVTKRKRTTKTNSDDGSETGDCDIDDDDDGADADGESNDARGMRVNVAASRRRSTQDSANDKRRTKDSEDVRRHSIAV
ncbi:hypothetical protein SCHPADRAFT_898540 [Schizopora paradoxa]|uniref:Shugoshin C-terminal domain-containing protein n=1 Tax=Schizopora paradoxa TaxID=27342 RepID=A0A0H2S5V4_9AGAM|nr:hypothetical protein SCHPADRAFT_898540 [Schizopora paradoxa]